jgi:hypothetical protein
MSYTIIPIKTLKASNKKYNQWITHEYLVLIKLKNYFYKKYRKQNDSEIADLNDLNSSNKIKIS